MSSQPAAPREPQPVDAIVLAGTRGNPPFQVEGRPVPKPHLVLGGQPLVARVVQAVLGARRVGRVYVVGRIDLLRESLSALCLQHPDRIRLIEEGQTILDNAYRAFFLHLLPDKQLPAVESPCLDPAIIAGYRERVREHLDLPVFSITADLPFVSSRAVDEFLQAAPADAAVVMGLVDHRQLERMQAVLGAECALDYWKLGALQLRSQSVRLNNLFLVRPLMMDPAFYRLLVELYAHRWLLRQDGRVNFANWWAIARATVSCSLRLFGFFRFLRGVVNFVPAALAACLARFTSRFGRWVSWPFRQFVSKRDVEFICSLMMGVQGHLIISGDPGSAVDVDVEESYHSLIKDGERDFLRIARYLETSSPRAPAPRPEEQQGPKAQSQA